MNLVAREAGIPKTRYTRIGSFSTYPRAPIIDKVRKSILIFFPLSPRLSYLVAAAFGDGSVSKRRLSYFNKDLSWLKKIALQLQQLTDSDRRIPRIFPPRATGVSSLSYSNCALARLISETDLARIRSVVVLTKTRVLLAAFAAGIFDCEGSACVYVNEQHPNGTPEISIANANVRMLRILQSRLRKLGIIGGISLSVGPRESTIEGRKVRGRKPVYRLRFSGWSSAMNLADFILPSVISIIKKKRLERIVTRGRRSGAVGI